MHTVSTTFSGPTHSRPGSTLRDDAATMISATVLGSSPKPCPITTGMPADSAVASICAERRMPPACLMPNFTKSAASQEPLGAANTLANQYGVNATPTILVGKRGGTLKAVDAAATDVGAYKSAIDAVLGQT